MKIPDPAMISSMLSSLYGYDVDVKNGDKIEDIKKMVKVIYVGDDKNPKVICLCDLNFANKSGAALTLIPTGMAEENIKAGKLPDDILENFREVVNVLCGLLNKDNAAHLVLGNVYGPQIETPEAIQNLLGDLTKCKNYTVKLKNYGEGKLSLLEVK